MTETGVLPRAHPVLLTARLDEPVSRWLWLVKWVLLIPHYIVLGFLWVAFLVVTAVAMVAIVITGRYPHALFAFNLGVIRWAARVHYYGYAALATDRYPPFTLGAVPDYPVTVEIEYPERLSRGLALVKWWLLAIPHYLILGVIVGGSARWAIGDDSGAWRPPEIGLLGLAVLIAAVAILFTGRYPRGLYDLLMGVGRWFVRVLAYAALMTDRYPPFRLDQGGSEPDLPARMEAPAPRPATAPRVGRVGGALALVIGVLLILAGAALGMAGAGGLWLDSHRDRGGYLTTEPQVLSTGTSAITVEDVNLHIDRGPGAWAVTDLGELRIRARSSGSPLFIGVARQADVDRWLGGVGHDEIADLRGGAVRYQRHDGHAVLSAPAAQPFWIASASGAGEQAVTWRPETGRWALVIARADAGTGLAATVDVGARAPGLAGAVAALLIGGLILLCLGIGLVLFGAVNLGRHTPPPGPPGDPASPTPPPAPQIDGGHEPSTDPVHQDPITAR